MRLLKNSGTESSFLLVVTIICAKQTFRRNAADDGSANTRNDAGPSSDPGPAPEVPGFFLGNGFSGYGVMHAPARGKILSDLILTGNMVVRPAAGAPSLMRSEPCGE